MKSLCVSASKVLAQGWVAFVLLLAVTPCAFAENWDREAVKILEAKCKNCHGGQFEYARLRVMQPESLLAEPQGDSKFPFVTPGAPDQSRLWISISEDRMPEEGEPLSESEKEVIYKWIEAGGSFPNDYNRTRVTTRMTLEYILDDLKDAPTKDRQFFRYFTLAHLHNNPKQSDRNLQIYRAALAKAVNSMSEDPRIVLPEAIDQQKTIYRIDLRDYGWDAFTDWKAVLKEYPYGLLPVDRKEADLLDDIFEFPGRNRNDEIPVIHADWFVATAMQPKIYHVLTKTPDTMDALLVDAKISIKENFNDGTSKRAALFKSGVSSQNRLIEYHPSRAGDRFWISYDFRDSSGRGNLARFPLGPNFDNHEFEDLTFQHAGGEIIYPLANGLHGYMLVDETGKRIDVGPPEIVWDRNFVSGSPLIENGLSCVSCHKHGMIELEDFVREGHAVNPRDARDKIADLYATSEELAIAVDDSKRRYLDNLRKVYEPFFDLAGKPESAILAIEEPISWVALAYNRNLDLETVACELGIEDASQLIRDVQQSGLRELGLSTLAAPGGSIKRSAWDSKEPIDSVFQKAARQLRIGIPN